MNLSTGWLHAAALTVCFICVSCCSVSAQSTDVKVSVKPYYFRSTNSGYVGSFRCEFFTSDTEKFCTAINGGQYNVNHIITGASYIFQNRSMNLDDKIYVNTRAWQEHSSYQCGGSDGCGRGDCQYNGGCSCGDEWLCDRSSGNRFINLRALEPGRLNYVSVQYCNHEITYEVSYTMPTPQITSVKANGENYTGAQLCANTSIDVFVNTALVGFDNSISYRWEYNIGGQTSRVWESNPEYCGYSDRRCPTYGNPPGGPNPDARVALQPGGTVQPLAEPPPGEDPKPPACCYVSSGFWRTYTVWNTLTTTYANNDKGTLHLDLLSIRQLAGLAENTSIQLRVKAVGGGSSSNPAERTIEVSPRAPTISRVLTDASCPNASTGKISLTGIAGSGMYKYTIRPGHNNNKYCEPIDACLTGIQSGEITGASGTIAGIPHNHTYYDNGVQKDAQGQYTLWVSNYGGTRGVCSSTHNITIDKIPELALAQAEPLKDASCHGYADGQITLASTGGAAPYVYTLTKTETTTQGNGIFAGLSAGTYKATVRDACQQVSAATVADIVVNEPKAVTADVTGSVLTCNSPADGVVMAGISDGPGSYSYFLRQGETLVTKLENTANVGWTVNGRSAGAYTVEIRDAVRPTCPAFTAAVTVGAPPVMNLTAQQYAVTEVTCNDGADGKVTLSGIDLSGKYQYTLTRQADNTTVSTTTEPFLAGLRAGTYTLAMRRNQPSCLDVFAVDNISVGQPSPITIALAKQDISCYGRTDGTATASVSGGTGTQYSYTWEMYTGSAWSTLSTTAASLTGRTDGDYRVRVQDVRHCTAVSEAVTIAEPTLLTLPQASVQDIKCFGERGSLALAPQGGTAPYAWQYSVGGAYTPFTASTALPVGVYTVRVLDKNYCEAVYTSSLTITSPPAALDFQYTQSNYNGFQISCFGGANGHVTLTGTGGNGSSYTNYTYALDGGAYQPSSRLEGIAAGNHVLAVRDARGCEVSKTIAFMQAAEQITLALKTHQDVVCYGDRTGSLEVTGTGGVNPYTFSLDAGTAQASPVFSGLGTGEYSITLADLNGCAVTATFGITSLNPAIVIDPVVQDVSCYQGNNGTITLNLAGGVPPFRYKWTANAGTTEALTGLTAGTYMATVTDHAGCSMQSTAIVQQPAQAVSLSLATTPVCYGSEHGSIAVTAQGGTWPYTFSADGGTSFQDTPVFATLGVGRYTVKVKDSHDCEAGTTTEIVQRNDRPEPDFIVATSEYALDTLVVTEISVPKPDSIDWMFDARAQILDANPWTPKLRFDDAGTYAVAMTGYFGGCAYTVARTLGINPYDPEQVKTQQPEYRAIKSVEVMPNPNNGSFAVKVVLNYKHRVSILVYDVLGSARYRHAWEEVQELTQQIDLGPVAAGVYLLRVVTGSDAEDVRIVVN
jgi:hypothetical protein